jgi:hypothetical protein
MWLECLLLRNVTFREVGIHVGCLNAQDFKDTHSLLTECALFGTHHHGRLQNISLLLLNKLQAHSSDWFTVLYFIAVTNVWKGLVVSEKRMRTFHMERFNLNKVNELEDKHQYEFEIPNRFAALENIDAEVDISSSWEIIKENTSIRISAKNNLFYYELKKNSRGHVSMKDVQNY